MARILSHFKILIQSSLVLITLSCVLFVAQIANAVSSDFRVPLLIGTDTTPPSVPAPFTATPIATTQIDLAWGTSSDDFIFSGYHVWRDNIVVATTTNTFYSDTGLIASTTYLYYVTAFDSFYNESASSTAVATTTLSPPPPTPTSTATTTPVGPSFGSAYHLADEIIALLILPERDSVIIRYETRGFIRAVMKWGMTTSYEMGSSVERAFTKYHEIKITGLTPGTTYSFLIEGENKIGRYGAMHIGTFMTLPPEDVFPPENVKNLTAIRSGADVILTWVNPSDTDLAKVRVVRNNTFFPSDIADGWVVYEGDDETARDKGVVGNGNRVYYTVFAYDELGNISSGAVVSLYIGDGIDTSGGIVDPSANTISLSLDDIVFSQEGVQLPVLDGKIALDGAKHLTITLPYEKVPRHLKTILVTIHDGTVYDRTFSFLLRVTKDMSGYTGVVAPFGTSGDYPIQVSVFDYKTAQIGYTDGTLISRIASFASSEGVGIGFLIQSIFMTLYHSYTLWFIALIIALMYASRRLHHAQS